MRHSVSRIGRNPRHVHSTEGCVCGSTYSEGTSQFQFRAAARGSSCLGNSGHPNGSQQRHPRYTVARSAGRPWVARTQFNTADHSVGNTPNMVEQRRSKTGALATRALLTKICCVMTIPKASVQYEMSDSQVVNGGQARENPDDCGACTVSRAETRSDATT